MFKESRFIFEEAAPEGAQCSAAQAAELKRQREAEFAGKTLSDRRKLSGDILAGRENAPCGDVEKRVAIKEFLKYKKDKEEAIKKKYRDLWTDVEINTKDGASSFTMKSEDGSSVTKIGGSVDYCRETIAEWRQKELDALEKEKITVVLDRSSEPLPTDEQALLPVFDAAQKKANGLYWNLEDGDDRKLALSDLRRIQGVAGGPLSFEKDFERWNVSDLDDIDLDQTFFDQTFFDQTFFDQHLTGFELNLDPAGRLYGRAQAVEFLRQRGVELSPSLRARTYHALAQSLILDGTLDKDLDLAEKLLRKEIEILEKIKVEAGDQWSTDNDTYYQEAVLLDGYAYKFLAHVLREKNRAANKLDKPDPEIIKLLEKDNNWTELYRYKRYFEKKFKPTDWVKYADEHEEDTISLLYADTVRYVLDSKNWGEFMARLDELYTMEAKEGWGGILGRSPALELVVQLYGPKSDAASRRGVVEAILGPELLSAYENSPVVGDEIKRVLDFDLTQMKVFDVRSLVERVHTLAELKSKPRKLKLLQARLLDGWAPAGQEDRGKALGYYREVLAGGINRGWQAELTDQEIADVLARCYRAVNGPDMYSAGEYLQGGTVVGEEMQFSGDHAEIVDPEDNLVVLFYDPKNKQGILVNRYVNLKISDFWNEDDYREKNAELKRLKREKADAAKIAEVQKEVDELRKKLAPEGMGGIHFFSNGAGELYVRDKLALQVVSDRENADKFCNDVMYPWEGYTGDALDLLACKSDRFRYMVNYLSGTDSGNWIPVKSDGAPLYFDQKTNKMVKEKPNS